jgi:hypothetical protein
LGGEEFFRTELGAGKMNPGTVYQDHLINLTNTKIVFHHYYFPFRKDKVVDFENIEGVSVKKNTLRNGKWRLHGTGDFKTWFSEDYDRPNRDRIFIATLKNQRIKVGFTAVGGDQVETILRSRNLISEK